MEERLIEAVKMHPCLFDKSSSLFRNKYLKDRAWQAVAVSTGVPEDHCKGRWKSLRDRFVREIGSHKVKSGAAAEEKVEWCYMESMRFLTKHVCPRKRPAKFKKLLDDELVVDCKFIVGPEDSTAETIVGHKVMFVLESPVLEKMLTGNFVESKNKIIRIRDVLPQHFKNFRFLVYTNDLRDLSKFSTEEIIELYHIANKYMVASISKGCLKFFRSTLNVPPIERLLTIYEFACEIEDKTLQHAIDKKLAKNGETNLKSCKLNVLSMSSFYEHIHYLSTFSPPPKPIASYNRINDTFSPPPKPIAIFNGIESYFKSNGLIELANKTTELEKNADEDINEIKDFNDIRTFKINLLNLVNFEKMSLKEFIDGPGKCELLEVQQRYDLLTVISLKNVTINPNYYY